MVTQFTEPLWSIDIMNLNISEKKNKVPWSIRCHLFFLILVHVLKLDVFEGAKRNKININVHCASIPNESLYYKTNHDKFS